MKNNGIVFGVVLGMVSFSSIHATASTDEMFGTPKIGDQALYEQTIVYEGKILKSQWEKQIVEAADDNEQFLIEWKDPNSGLLPMRWWVLRMGLFYIKDIDFFCSMDRGDKWSHQIEDVQTPAGKFKACRLESLEKDKDTDKCIIWYSDEIPFGELKFYQVWGDGGTEVHEQVLIDFKW